MSLAHDGQGTSPPRVLILSGFWPPHEGGVERYAQAMADELAARGWQVHAAFSAVIGAQVGALHHDAPDTGEMEPAHEPDTESARVPSGAALRSMSLTCPCRCCRPMRPGRRV